MELEETILLELIQLVACGESDDPDPIVLHGFYNQLVTLVKEEKISLYGLQLQY